MATPFGALNPALVPIPSFDPDAVPELVPVAVACAEELTLAAEEPDPVAVTE